MHHLMHGLASVMGVGLNQTRFPHHVQIISFDQEAALATRAAFIALIPQHDASVARDRIARQVEFLVIVRQCASVAYGLSFSPEFYQDGERPPASLARPYKIADAIMGLSQDTWNELAERVFGVDPSQLDLSMVLAKIEETNTCRNLDSPVEVYIDPEGEFSVHVYDSEPPSPES